MRAELDALGLTPLDKDYVTDFYPNVYKLDLNYGTLNIVSISQVCRALDGALQMFERWGHSFTSKPIEHEEDATSYLRRMKTVVKLRNASRLR